MFDILAACEAANHYAVEIYTQLHRHPELSGQETETLRLIGKEMTSMDISYVEVPQGGILGCITGKGGGTGKTVLLRADCDALPMQESTCNARQAKRIVSQKDGAAHTCGHDTHVSMLLAAARILKEHADAYPGKVLLLFERGEETGEYIQNVLDYVDTNRIRIDSCFAVHVTADLPVGQVGIPSGSTNAGCFPFDIELTGRGGHGSTPSKVNNPIDCFQLIMAALKDIRMKYVSPFDPATIQVCTVHAGDAFNVTPETLRFSGSCRYFRPEVGKDLTDRLRRTIDSSAQLCGCEVIYHRFQEQYMPSYNDPHCAALSRSVVMKIIPEENIRPRNQAMGSESFGALSTRYPSVKANTGVRNERAGMIDPTHSPRFEADPGGMTYGTMLYVSYAAAYLNEPPDCCVSFIGE